MNVVRAEYLSENAFSLGLSSGYFGFFAHTGFMKALYEIGLFPKAISGTSGGAIVAAAVASGLSANDLTEVCLKLKKADFWRPQLGWGLVSGHRIEELIAGFCAPTFSHTKIPLHISAYRISQSRVEVLSEGKISTAAQASAAVPLLFHPVKIGSSYYWDGALGDRPGIAGLINDSGPKLIHYLESKDRLGRFEDNYIYKGIFKNPWLLSISNPYKTGPNALDVGPQIISHYYQETVKWLQQKVEIFPGI